MARQADSSAIVTVSSAVTADTDGDWVELFLSASKNTKWMLVSLISTTVASMLAKFDIGTGNPGEQVDDILQDQFAKWTVSANTGLVNTVFSFPMPIDAGTRLWIRIKDENAAIRDYFAVVTLSTIPLSTVLPISSESFSIQEGVPSADIAGGFGNWVTMFPSLAANRTWLCLMLYRAGDVSPKARFDLGSEDPRVVDWGELHFQKKFDTAYHAKACVYNMPVSWAKGDQISIRVKDQLSTSQPYDVGAVIF